MPVDSGSPRLGPAPGTAKSNPRWAGPILRGFRLQYIDDETRARIQNRRISVADIEYCLSNPRATYSHRGDTVTAATLPDGRNIKVTTNPDGTILNAFTHQ